MSLCLCVSMFFIVCFTALPGFAGEPPRRIVSLAPGLTELVCALGLERNLAGVTTYCDRPASIKGKPKVGGPENPSLEALVRLKPDLVLLDEEGSTARLAQRLHKLGIRTFVFRGSRLDRLASGIRELGRELGAGTSADRLAQRIEQSIQPLESAHPVRTMFVIWPDPLIAAGPASLLDDAMKLSGMDNIAADARSAYPRLSLEAVVRRAPQLIVVGQGHALKTPVKRMLAHLSSLEAVHGGQICMVGDALYRPGPRIPEGIEELRRCRELAARGNTP